jgi:hypothetical protein
MLLPQAMGQSTQQTTHSFQYKAVPVEHLYWHFLAYQHHLDEVAAIRDLQGKNGDVARTKLQSELGFSTADYAVIHTSATRLTTHLKNIDVKTKTLLASAKSSGSGSSSSVHEQLKALSAERESTIQAEIDTINQSLTTEQRAALKAYILKIFSSSKAVQQ